MSDEYERKMERWFRHLPPDHPLVKVLFKAAVDRARGLHEVLPQQRDRR